MRIKTKLSEWQLDIYRKMRALEDKVRDIQTAYLVSMIIICTGILIVWMLK